MKFPFIFKPKDTSPWTWPTCTNNVKTLSFRALNSDLNPTHLLEQGTDTIESDKNYRKEILSNAYAAADDDDMNESAVIKGLRSSDRLFFEPGNTSSILEEAAKSITEYSRQSSTDVCLLEMDSINPIFDFRVSMEEMVEAHGLKNWDCLEKLLARYLRVNEKRNHGYVIAAFVDLMLDLGLDLVASCDDGDDDCCTSNCAEVDVNQGSCFSLSGNTTFPMSFCASSSCSSTSPAPAPAPALSLLGHIVDDVKSCASSR